MAEQEVIKHTKKIYKVWNSKQHSFWHKAKEFLIEIFIIVFAVSLSIWFHSWSEHRHQQEDVKQFLLGLKSDLKKDILEMKGDSTNYQYQKATFGYVTSIKKGADFNADSMKKYNPYFTNYTFLNPNNGRFEGFKASGKIGFIENNELQNDIMDLYQEDIVALLNSTEYYIEMKKTLVAYMLKNIRRLTDSTNNSSAMLLSDEAQNMCQTLGGTEQVVARYHVCISKAEKIIAGINKEYGLSD